MLTLACDASVTITRLQALVKGCLCGLPEVSGDLGRRLKQYIKFFLKLNRLEQANSECWAGRRGRLKQWVEVILQGGRLKQDVTGIEFSLLQRLMELHQYEIRQ